MLILFPNQHRQNPSVTTAAPTRPPVPPTESSQAPLLQSDAGRLQSTQPLSDSPDRPEPVAPEDEDEELPDLAIGMTPFIPLVAEEEEEDGEHRQWKSAGADDLRRAHWEWAGDEERRWQVEGLIAP